MINYVFNYCFYLDRYPYLFSRIASSNPNLSELVGKRICGNGLLSMLEELPLSQLSVLEILFDSKDMADDTISRLCYTCPNLIKLNLSKDLEYELSLTDSDVDSIVTYCPMIQVLSLHGWWIITDFSMEYLTQLEYLYELDLSGCDKLTSNGIQGLLRTKPALKSLILCGNDFNNVLPYVDAALLTCIGTYCHVLTRLHVTIPASGMKVIDRSDLIYFNSNITNDTLTVLIQGCPLLEDFQLHAESDISISVFATLAYYCPHLHRLHTSSVQVSDENVRLLCQGCPRLISLHLDCVRSITDSAIYDIATHFQQLQEFTLSHNDNITDETLCSLFTNCVNLYSIHLGHISHMTDHTLMSLLQHCPLLQSLELVDVSQLTDCSLYAIATYAMRLEHLELSYMSAVTDDLLTRISQRCKCLHTVELWGCLSITNIGIRAILTHCIHLTELSVYECIGVREMDELRAECIERKKRYKCQNISISG